MEIAATRCILAAMERQLMASSRGAHGLCSNCAETRGADQTEFLHKSWQKYATFCVLTGNWRLERKRST